MDTMISLHEQIQSQLGSFGTRLQELRLQQGWTLQEVADRSGLSKAFLSRLESGGRHASISAVLTLSRVFDVTLASLFENEVSDDPCVIVRRAEMVEQTANGLTYVPLSRASRIFNLQPIRVKVSRWRRGNEHYHHEGEEWIYVLSGSLTLSLAGKLYELEPGDAAHFDSRLPHRLIPRGSRDPELLVVAAPLAQSAAGSRSAIAGMRAVPSLRLMDFPPADNLLRQGKPPGRASSAGKATTQPAARRRTTKSPTTTKT